MRARSKWKRNVQWSQNLRNYVENCGAVFKIPLDLKLEAKQSEKLEYKFIQTAKRLELHVGT